jgi:putative FmdB family regulatory protein
MPLYEFQCESCGLKFEELIGKTDVSTVACKSCGKDAERQVSRFSSTIAGGSVNETVDMSVGREANARWQAISDRQSKRIGDKKLEPVSIPKSQDGKYMPVMALGDKIERKQKTEYVSALQDHRKKRVEKGQGQFDGPGSF